MTHTVLHSYALSLIAWFRGIISRKENEYHLWAKVISEQS